MDVREKLIDLIIDAKRTDPETGCFTEHLADHLISNGATVQEWIPVTEKLPDFGSRVIACGEKGGVFIVKSEGTTIGFGRMDGTSKYRSFTHWMPIPQPPKGE